EDPLVLYLALLLHDSGKAVGARPHSEASALFAQRVAARLQLSSEQRKSLILLVDHHLTLSRIAQQRNLDDPATVTEFGHIVKHLKLFRSFLENASGSGEFPLSPAINWKIVPEQGHSVVTFCTWERERLLAKIAGSFAVVPLNILSADVFSRGDNLVLAIFRVCDTNARPVTNPRDFELVEQTLRRALEDETFDFLPGIEKAKRQTRRLAPGIEFPTRIAIDNKTHPTYTLVEIQAPDRIGLLYDVLSCLDRENILIPLSRINT